MINGSVMSIYGGVLASVATSVVVVTVCSCIVVLQPTIKYGKSKF